MAYVSPAARRGPLDLRQIRLGLRERLPAHMVPAYMEELTVLPTMTSGKVDRKRLPPPQRRRSPDRGNPTHNPRRPYEAILAQELAGSSTWTRSR